jgi:hypothetical protein
VPEVLLVLALLLLVLALLLLLVLAMLVVRYPERGNMRRQRSSAF